MGQPRQLRMLVRRLTHKLKCVTHLRILTLYILCNVSAKVTQCVYFKHLHPLFILVMHIYIYKMTRQSPWQKRARRDEWMKLWIRVLLFYSLSREKLSDVDLQLNEIQWNGLQYIQSRVRDITWRIKLGGLFNIVVILFKIQNGVGLKSIYIDTHSINKIVLSASDHSLRIAFGGGFFFRFSFFI